MEKTRAEIQKAYRERKKLSDPNFLNKEKLRQASYRVPASEKDKKRLQIDREKNKLYCYTYRQKLKEKKNEKMGVDSTDSTETLPTQTLPTQSEVASTCSSSDLTTRSSNKKLTVRLPYFKKITPSKKRSKALRKARGTIAALENKIKDVQRSNKRWQKRFERLKHKTESGHIGNSSIDLTSQEPFTPSRTVLQVSTTEHPDIPSTPNHQTSAALSTVNVDSPVTPRTRTETDLRKSGVSPRSLPQSVVRKLVVNECLLAEIRKARKENKSQKHRNVISTIVSGKIVKKYRCAKHLKTSLGISRLPRSDSKKINDCKRKRLLEVKRHVSETVLHFFNRDDISRMLPGKKDSVKLGESREQKRILNDYLTNIYDKFCAEENGMTISFSAFCKLRPPNIKLTSLLSRNTCLCTIHQNMALKLKSLRSHGGDISPNPEVCKKSITLENMNEILQSLQQCEIEFEEWQRVEIDEKKKMKIVKVTKSKADFIEYMINQYELFLEHVSRVTAQYKALRELKNTLPANHVIVQMDFAENFTCSSMDEIQSAYWNSTSVTLHPVVAYGHGISSSISLEHKNFVLISDLISHNSTAVFAILKIIVPEIKECFPNTTHIHYWTDSPTSQYRNRYIFNIISRHEKLFGIKARWDYFEAGHGKGPCDGIGGICKRMASECVKQGKVIIQDAKEFYEWAIKYQKTVLPLYYSHDDYDASTDYLKTLPPKPIPGTMKLHAVCPGQEDGKLLTRDVSCYCKNCLIGEDMCDGWREHWIDGSCTKPTSTNCVQAENQEYIPEVGTFVSAFYDGDWYIGKVLEVENEDSEAFVSFMTKHSTKGVLSLRWPPKPDEILVSFRDIICRVSDPIPIGRTQRYFALNGADLELIQTKV